MNNETETEAEKAETHQSQATQIQAQKDSQRSTESSAREDARGTRRRTRRKVEGLEVLTSYKVAARKAAREEIRRIETHIRTNLV